MTDRKTLDQMTSDDLDQLYARIDTLEHAAASHQQHARLTARDLAHADAERETLRTRLGSALASMKLLRLYANQLDHDGQVAASDVARRLHRIAAGLDQPAPEPGSNNAARTITNNPEEQP
jgi:hypothetical protein